jgi:leucyl aminopeptidase
MSSNCLSPSAPICRLFCTMDEVLAAEIARFGAVTQDPVWRLPLWDSYKGKIADLTNISGEPFACSITATLFLRRFVP